MSVLEAIPISKPVRTTEPTLAQEPVSVDEARRQCGIGDGIEYHNSHLAMLIAAAREQVENDTGLVCYTGSFTQKFTDFGGDILPLDYVRPVTSVTSIAYLDSNGDSQTLATSVYAFESANVKQFIRLKYDQTWPSLRGDVNGITVTFVAGYASVLTIPARIKQAVLLRLHIEWMLKNEQDVSDAEAAYARCLTRLSRSTYP